MKILIYGGEASGKSAYAEDIAVKMAQKEGLPLYYVATMDKNAGGDTLSRIEKHKKMREGKGFITLEQPKSLEKLSFESENGVILLEDVGNLVCNELFTSKTAPVSVDRHDVNTNYAVSTKIRSGALSAASLSASVNLYADSMAKQIADSIDAISAQAAHIILVGNSIFDEATTDYTAETHIFMQTLASVMNIFAQTAEKVTEIVAGIPISLK